MRLLHFSDVHLQLPRWRERSWRELGALRAVATGELWKGRGKLYDDAAEALRAIVRAVDTERADHAVLTGDLTQLGHPEEFALAAEVLAPLLPDRLTVIAGNHDRFPLSGRPSKLFEQHFPGQPRNDLALPLPVRLVDETALIALDSAGEMSWPIISNGRLGPPQLDALATTLRAPELQGRCKLVLVHHAPLRKGGRPDWPWHALRGASGLLRVCAEGGAEAILCGHLHGRFDEPARPGRPRVLNAASSTEKGREGYFVLEIAGGRISAVTQRSLP